MKDVFLTGASAGIGRAIAVSLADKGNRVWGTSRSRARLPKHENFYPIELDLRDMDSIYAGVTRAMKESGGFDVLINNAGSGIFSSLEQLSHEQLTSQFQLLVFAPMQIVKLLLPTMRNRGGGLIVNITSLAALFPIPYMGAYSACKAAMSSLNWTLEMELCREPIGVVELRPGDIRTDFHKVMECHNSVSSNNSTENIVRAYRTYMDHMERAPSPELVAESVLDVLENHERASPRQNVGTVFQSRIAPLFAKLSPHKWTRMALKKYYRLTCRRS